VHVQDYNRLVEIINGRFEKGRGLQRGSLRAGLRSAQREPMPRPPSSRPWPLK